MSKLTFKNFIGDTIEFSESSIYKWLQVSDLGGGVVRNQTTSSPFQDGETSVGTSYFDSKLISIDFVIVSDNPQSAIRSLHQIVNPKIGIGSLILENEGVTRVLDKVKTRVMPTLQGNDRKGETFQFTSITFEIYDPFYSDENFTSQDVGTGDLNFEFPLNITDTFTFDTLNTEGIVVNNAGDVECPVTIIIDGAVTQPLTITNVTTGEKIVINLDIPIDTQITITTEIDNINVIQTNPLTLVSSSAFEFIDVAETTFFYLAKGENTILITGNEGDVEVATFKYKNKYVGV